MVVIGLTGGYGTGKSTVAAMFQELGAVVLDADRITHKLMEPKKLVWRRIIDAFGDSALNEDATINRKQLAEIIFKDSDKRLQLESIIHPQVIKYIKRQLHQIKGKPKIKAIVLDVPLLIEAGAEDMADVIVVVTASPEVQQERLLEKYGSQERISGRIKAQMDMSAKVALADHVIDNSDGVENTRTQVRNLWNKLL